MGKYVNAWDSVPQYYNREAGRAENGSGEMHLTFL